MGSHRTKILFAYLVIYFVWGTTYFGIHYLLKSFPPFLLSSLRLLIAGSALALICFVRKEIWPTGNEFFKQAASGIAIFFGGIVAIAWGQQFISSSLASTVITTPFWFVVLDKRQWNFYFSTRWIPAGLLLGLTGVILLMAFKTVEKGDHPQTMQLLAILVIVVGSFLWAGTSLYLKYSSSASSVLVNTTIQLLSAFLVTLPISYFVGEFDSFTFQAVTTQSVLVLFYLSLVSSLLGFLCYIWLIKVQPPAIVSTYAYVNPLVATLLGWTLGSENISPIQLGALAIILIGVLFVNIPKYMKQN